MKTAKITRGGIIMKGRKRSIATRRKKEEVMEAKAIDGLCEKALIVAGLALVGAFLKGFLLGYLLGKNR